jgi:hypothetical protein
MPKPGRGEAMPWIKWGDIMKQSRALSERCSLVLQIRRFMRLECILSIMMANPLLFGAIVETKWKTPEEDDGYYA